MSDATKYLVGRIKQGDEVNALKATIKEQAAEIERLKADAYRYRYIRDNQYWTRHGHESDRPSEHFAVIGCKFPYEIDFSYKAGLDIVIDQLIPDEHATITNGTT